MRKRPIRLSHALSFFAVTMFLLLLLLIGILVGAYKSNSELSEQYIDETGRLYVSPMNDLMSTLSVELARDSENNEYLGRFPGSVQPINGAALKALRSIRQENSTLKAMFLDVAEFFYYSKSKDLYINAYGATISQSIYTTLYSRIVKNTFSQKEDNSVRVRWEVLSEDDEYLICGYFTKKGDTIGCLINIRDLLEKLRSVPSTYEVIPVFETTSGDMITLKDETISENLLSKRQYEYRLQALGKIHLYMNRQSGVLQGAYYLQILIIFSITGVLVICILFLLNYYRSVLAPMRRFSESMENLELTLDLSDNGKNHILELEQASSQFKEQLRKIQKLRIALYEKELEQQKVDLELLQEEIRPHFFLNCLSVIHNMADMKGVQDIVEITENLSDYLRYLFKNEADMRLLREEIQHLNAFVHILKLRYGEDSFHFYIDADEDLLDYYLPELILQTLVENSIMHGMKGNEGLDISLFISTETLEDGRYLYICVSDTGPGFDEAYMEAIMTGQEIYYNGRRHIGLQNIRQRLKLLYHDRAQFSISNMDDHFGAITEIRIDLSLLKKDSSPALENESELLNDRISQNKSKEESEGITISRSN